MNKIIIALVLTVVANTTFAAGFKPWDERNVAKDQHAPVSTMKLPPIGFAPWQERANANAFAQEHGVAMEIKTRNIFRPWS